MFCVNCGNEVISDSQYCSNCGHSIVKPLPTEQEGLQNNSEHEQLSDQSTENVSAHTIIETMPTDPVLNNSLSRSFERKFWLLPAIAAVIAIALPLGLYFYEVNVTNQVENDRKKAESLALQGKIEEALILVDQGLNQRPNNKPLQSDKEFLQLGKKANDHLVIVDTLIQKQDYPKALDELALAEKEIAANKGNLFDFLRKKIEDKETGVVVLQIKKDMNSKSTIEDLAVLLTKVSAYDVQEAKDTVISLKKRIGEIAYKQANDYLQKKDFTRAMTAIDNGLQYDPDNDKLISFKQTIAQQQQDFQKTQEERIQQAMISAMKEDKNNKTNAVQILEYTGTIDQYGDYIIRGQIRNIATRPITFVEIYYSVYDANGYALSSGSTYVYPNYLNPNDGGSFQTTEYGLVNAASVEVTQITWYLN